jgi:hypothetical protein
MHPPKSSDGEEDLEALARAYALEPAWWEVGEGGTVRLRRHSTLEMDRFFRKMKEKPACVGET